VILLFPAIGLFPDISYPSALTRRRLVMPRSKENMLFRDTDRSVQLAGAKARSFDFIDFDGIEKRVSDITKDVYDMKLDLKKLIERSK
jgi:hypothetical protein